MNLISYKSSWDLIQNVFKNYFNNNNLEINLFDIKEILFTKQPFIKDIVYIDNFKKNETYFYPTFWKYPRHKLILVLNNTVTELPYSSLNGAETTGNIFWYLVFKHSAAELNNITYTAGNPTGWTTTNNTIFEYKKIYVPVGLRNDYITFFSNLPYWHPEYADQIVEGDEYDIE